MPGSVVDSVDVATGHCVVSLLLTSREALLGEIVGDVRAAPVLAAFARAGLTEPVVIPRVSRAYLIRVIDEWADRLGTGPSGLPKGIWMLRGCLVADQFDDD
jgi:hypothetical protein